MSDKQLMEELIGLVREFKGDDMKKPAKEMAAIHIGDDLEMDSLDLINFLFRIEEKYRVKITGGDIEAKDLLVLGNLADYVAQKR